MLDQLFEKREEIAGRKTAAEALIPVLAMKCPKVLRQEFTEICNIVVALLDEIYEGVTSQIALTKKIQKREEEISKEKQRADDNFELAQKYMLKHEKLNRFVHDETWIEGQAALIVEFYQWSSKEDRARFIEGIKILHFRQKQNAEVYNRD